MVISIHHPAILPNFGILLPIILGLMFLFLLRIGHAEMVMGVEMSPAMCHMHPDYAPLRQCSENKPVNVSYFSIGMQGRCSSQIKLALSPLQEKIATGAVADPYMRQQLWQNYGVCSGITPATYFHQLTSFFNALKLPNEILSTGTIRVNHGSFLKAMNRANPTLTSQSIRLTCQLNSSHKPVLTHMNICYSNAGSYQKCTTVRPSNCPSNFYIEGR